MIVFSWEQSLMDRLITHSLLVRTISSKNVEQDPILMWSSLEGNGPSVIMQTTGQVPNLRMTILRPPSFFGLGSSTVDSQKHQRFWCDWTVDFHNMQTCECNLVKVEQPFFCCNSMCILCRCGLCPHLCGMLLFSFQICCHTSIRF